MKQGITHISDHVNISNIAILSNLAILYKLDSTDKLLIKVMQIK